MYRMRKDKDKLRQDKHRLHKEKHRLRNDKDRLIRTSAVGVARSTGCLKIRTYRLRKGQSKAAPGGQRQAP
jgi:hypothetical protein